MQCSSASQQPYRAGHAARYGAKLLRRCADCGAVLVVDECFLDFLAARDALTAKTVLRDASNLIILKAFTKLYAMAGVRLGYALCSDAALLDKTRGGPAVGRVRLAQAAGLAALEETAYADSVRTLIADQRPRLAAGLRALGLRVVDGQANYLLFRAPADFSSCAVTVVAGCGNYPGWTRRGTAPLCAPKRKRTAVENYAGGAGMSRAGCIMVQGTMSGAGKACSAPHSAAFCPGWLQDGTVQKPEHGVEQLCDPRRAGNGPRSVVQAQAAGVEPDVRMNRSCSSRAAMWAARSSSTARCVAICPHRNISAAKVADSIFCVPTTALPMNLTSSSSRARAARPRST